MKIYIGKHKEWLIERTGNSQAEVASQLGCKVEDLTFTEMEKTDFLLRNVPTEFHSALSEMAYDRGHSAGYSEVELILEGLVANLMPSIQAFEQRIRREAGDDEALRQASIS